MTADHQAPSHWELIECGAHLRYGQSLANLAAPETTPGRAGVRSLLESLELIRPLDERHDHAWAHLDGCAQRARRMVENRAFGFATDDVAIIMSVYEAALIAAAGRQNFRLDEQPLGRFSLHDLDCIARTARGHGDTIQHWWSSYAAAIEALFGKPGS